MKLFLVRHAHPEFLRPKLDDFDRALTVEGLTQCAIMQQEIAELLHETTTILCSSSQRTVQTAAHILPAESLNEVRYQQNLYLAEVPQLLQIICAEKHANNLVLIGHNDGFSALVSYLTDEYIHLETCQLVGIALDIDSWAECSQGLGTVILNRLAQVF